MLYYNVYLRTLHIKKYKVYFIKCDKGKLCAKLNQSYYFRGNSDQIINVNKISRVYLCNEN